MTFAAALRVVLSRSMLSFTFAVLMAAAHGREYWAAIVKNKYAPPAGESIPPLAHELSGYLGSPDPELRDEFAYSILTAWIYRSRSIDDATLRSLIDEWIANLHSDGVYRRSFSALMLSVAVARDNANPFLRDDEFPRLLDAAEKYLASERDLRGYDPKHGWIHSVAHTSDLLKFLARSRYLTTAGQQSMLDAFAKKLTTSPVVFVDGEDERIARALLSIVKRDDFDQAAFKRWLSALPLKPPQSQVPEVSALHEFQNTKNVLSKLDVLLQNEQERPGVAFARNELNSALKAAF